MSLLRVANDLAAHVWQLAFLSHEFVLFWSCALIHLSNTCHLRSKAIGLSSPKPVSYEKETATLLASPFDEFVKVQVDATNGVAESAMRWIERQTLTLKFVLDTREKHGSRCDQFLQDWERWEVGQL